MKPAWDRLMGDFKDHATALVADVDCTAEGKPLCDASGVKGFPTIKWGSYDSLADYEGGRTYEDLKKFAGLVLLASIAFASAEFSLTPDNWDEETGGKTVFIKFQAPW